MGKKHFEGEPARVKGAKSDEEWVWHLQRYRTESGTRSFWTTVLVHVPVIGHAIVSAMDAYGRWQEENDK